MIQEEQSQSKKIIYIILFTILGILLSTILHAAIEIPVIYLLVSNFEKYSLGLSWSQWYLIHHIATAILLIAGVFLGAFWGFKYWNIIYENNLK